MKIKLLSLFLIFFSNIIKAQTIETIIKKGELLVTGISIFKTTKLTESKEKTVDNKFVATICIKNKLAKKTPLKQKEKILKLQKLQMKWLFKTTEKNMFSKYRKAFTPTKLYSLTKKFSKKVNINLSMKLQ